MAWTYDVTLPKDRVPHWPAACVRCRAKPVATVRIRTHSIGWWTPLTMSFGVAGSVGPELERERLLDEADAALYDAKARGRDQVVAATVALAAYGARLERLADEDNR